MKPAGTPLRAADWLSLAAAPVFGLMALLTAYHGDGHAGLLCSEAGQRFDLMGMGPMYLLMTAFHLAPWLRLTASS